MDLASLRKTLLGWYDRNARALPWRAPPGAAQPRDPYAVWVSEIMLQQTRVDTVLRYYEPFMARFPNVTALAEASEDAVMAAWSGLGYYRRARLLHQGVREVAARYGGQVPAGPEDRSGLPGVGRYTAGAIGSIAFGREEPIVDGNVMRVFARLFTIDTPLGAKQTEARMWELATALVAGPRPGDFNQALMELGATVCTKASPDCDRCPLRESCQARAAERQDALPVPRVKKPPKSVALVAVVARSGGRVCLQRGAGSLFGGLWNVPMAEGRGAGAASAVLAALGIGGEPERTPVASLEHVLTHRRLAVAVYTAAPGRTTLSDREDVRWCKPEHLDALGISSLTKKILRAVD